MNELTYMLAILVQKKVLTPLEARKLQKASAEGVVSTNLPEMMVKVDKSLKSEGSILEKISASDFLNLK